MPETTDRVVVAAVPASAAAARQQQHPVVEAAMEAAEGLVEVMLHFNLIPLGKAFCLLFHPFQRVI